MNTSLGREESIEVPDNHLTGYKEAGGKKSPRYTKYAVMNKILPHTPHCLLSPHQGPDGKTQLKNADYNLSITVACFFWFFICMF